jgi:hypothetical protein
VFISGRKRGVTPTIRKELRRRSAIEPVIGHMKEDGDEKGGLKKEADLFFVLQLSPDPQLLY